MSPEIITPESLPPAEPSAESPAAPSEVTLDKIQQADKYVGVQEKGTTAKEQEALRQRAAVLEQAWRGKEDSPEADQLRQSVAEFCTPAALATALEQQRSTGKTVIPESLLRNQDIKDELAHVAERIQRGVGFDTLLREANQAGEVNPDWLRSLKVLGTMIMQRHAPDGDQNKWQAMSEADKQLVRFAELLTNGTLIYSVRRRMEQKTLAPEVAGYLRQNFLGFRQNQDIPNAFKRDLIKITDRLAAYQRGQAEPSSSEGARADAATADTQSVLDEAQPTTTAETVVGKTGLTTIENKSRLINEPWQPYREKKSGDPEHDQVIDQRRERLAALAREPVDAALLDRVATVADQLVGPAAATSWLPREERDNLIAYFAQPEQRQHFQGLINRLRDGLSLTRAFTTEVQTKRDSAQRRIFFQSLETLGILWREGARGTARTFEAIPDEEAKAQVRLGEMIEHAAIANQLNLEQKQDKGWLQQQENAHPGYLKYHYRRLEGYGRSDDIPRTFVALLTPTTEQLKAAWQQYEQTRPASPFETEAIKQSPDYSSQRVEPRAAGSDEWTRVTNPAVEQTERTESYLLETDDTPWQDLTDNAAVTAKLQELQQYREFVTNGAVQLDSSRAVVDRLQGRRGPDLTPEQFDHWLQQIVGPDVGRTKLSPDRLQELREYISGGVSRDIERAGELRLRQEKPSSLLKKSGIWAWRLSGVGTIIAGSIGASRLAQQFSARQALLGGRKAALSFFRNQERGELLSRRHEVARIILQAGKELNQPALLDVAAELERLNLYELKIPATPATT